MTTKTELREELTYAIERIHDAMNPSDPFDMAYEADYVCTYILGIAIPELNEVDEVDPKAAAIRAAFPKQLKAFEQATKRWVAGGPEAASRRKDHAYALALLDILDTLK